MRTVSAIIVNWNAGSQLIDAISSLARFHHGFVVSVVIVDNASTDNSMMTVGALVDLPFQIHIIRNLVNVGFAAACNQGAKLVSSDYLLFLNPDTELFENSVVVPLSFMEKKSNKNVGICSIQLVGKSGHVDRSCSYFPSLVRFVVQTTGLCKISALRGAGIKMADWDHLSTKSVDQVIGAFFFLRQKVFSDLKGFDERFFVYFEEVDFCVRAKQAGWKTVYLKEAQAYHQGGGTSGQIRDIRLFYSLRSRLLYAMKHFSPWQTVLLFGLTLLLEPFTRISFSILCGSRLNVENTLKAYSMLYRDVINILMIQNNNKKRDE